MNTADLDGEELRSWNLHQILIWIFVDFRYYFREIWDQLFVTY